MVSLTYLVALLALWTRTSSGRVLDAAASTSRRDVFPLSKFTEGPKTAGQSWNIDSLRVRDGGQIYTVVSGDSAFNIATRFGITLDSLEAANANAVSNWNILPIGVVLQIPQSPAGSPSDSASGRPATTISAPSTPPQTTPAPGSVWTVASGETGNGIASQVGVPFSEISAANPSVVWTHLTAGETLQIPGAATATPSANPGPPAPSPTGADGDDDDDDDDGKKLSVVAGSLAVEKAALDQGKTTPASKYTFYAGDGSSKDGWPQMADWLSFNALFENVKPYIGHQCLGGGGSQQPGSTIDNSADETSQVKKSILSIAAQTYMDPRFILAVVMQESNGCVRVESTANGNGNPGLMQSYEGKGSCNRGSGQMMTPCPSAVIHQMIVDGTAAPVDGVTLVSGLNKATSGLSDGATTTEPAQAFYRAARYYNSGPNSLPADGDLGGSPGATLCYSSDIANRLVGWVAGQKECHLDDRK